MTMKKLHRHILLCLLSGLSVSLHAATPETSATQPADLRLSYNNDLIVDLAVGLWCIPMPYDYDNDGITDLLVSCPDTPYKGLYRFHNIGTNQKPLFDKAERVDTGKNDVMLSYVNGEPRVLGEAIEYLDFPTKFFGQGQPIEVEGGIPGADFIKIRSKMWNYVDWDADGDQDIIVGVGEWGDYGWDNAFNAEGKWTRGPLHGWVYLLENVNGKYINRGKILAGDAPIDVYGSPTPNVADFDGDGDLDIICGEFVDKMTWFENIGTRTEPKFAPGRLLSNKQGTIIMDLEMIVPVAYDFDGDGHPDLLVGDEDGRIAYLRNTGKVKNGMPQFTSPEYLKQKADALKFGALSTPYAIDWDGDGKQDIISGNSAGYLCFIKNLDGDASAPAWAAPQFLTVNGEPIRIQAGYNGSIQGPCEAKWGYTVLNVADWDGDGINDIIINSIWGKIQWFKGKKSGGTDFEPARDVLVAWEGPAPKPAWNWWNPEPNTLATQWRTTPCVIDWNNDGLPDLIMLDHEGYLSYFERFEKDGERWLRPGKRIFICDNASTFDHQYNIEKEEAGILRLNEGEAGKSGRRKFCFVDWDGDGDLDLIANSRNAEWFENMGTDEKGNTHFMFRGNIANARLAGHTTCPTPVDWNNDGVPDILLGAEDGHFYLLKNNVR